MDALSCRGSPWKNGHLASKEPSARPCCTDALSFHAPESVTADEWLILARKKRHMWPMQMTSQLTAMSRLKFMQRERRRLKARHTWEGIHIRWTNLHNRLFTKHGLRWEELYSRLFCNISQGSVKTNAEGPMLEMRNISRRDTKLGFCRLQQLLRSLSGSFSILKSDHRNVAA